MWNESGERLDCSAKATKKVSNFKFEKIRGKFRRFEDRKGVNSLGLIKITID